ncbi:MAG: hypothetical protein IJO96_03720, partial [Oscillospiraceae bacterium]|nr:hypothetical protein [Oscillospiraceae bacterium]
MKKCTAQWGAVLKKSAVILLGSAILSFGLYNVHELSGVTEGGILGLTLFFYIAFLGPELCQGIQRTVRGQEQQARLCMGHFMGCFYPFDG